MSRPLLIPQKRRLLDRTGKELKPDQKLVPQVINPSAVPAETRIQKSLRDLFEDAEADPYAYNEAIAYYGTPEPTEWRLGDLPQPFLDPDLWEAMLKRARERQQEKLNETNQGNGSQLGGSATESADQRRRREGREVEYGSMAIRGRASLGRAPALGSRTRTRRSGG